VGVSETDLSAYFEQLNDDELLREFRSGALTELAQRVVVTELRRRGIDTTPPGEAGPAQGQESADGGDPVPIARFFSVAEADVLRSRLEAEGIPAFLVDAQTVQTIPLMAIGFGGVRVFVPEADVGRAREIMQAVEKGDYALGDDSGADPP
jgi:Putative prokaryotic signal transducing protein